MFALAPRDAAALILNFTRFLGFNVTASRQRRLITIHAKGRGADIRIRNWDGADDKALHAAARALAEAVAAHLDKHSSASF